MLLRDQTEIADLGTKAPLHRDFPLEGRRMKRVKIDQPLRCSPSLVDLPVETAHQTFPSRRRDPLREE